jgi:O-antigen/teichoic acid export membrane protein
MNIINTLNEMKKNELFRASLILIVLVNIANAFSYLYQVTMARMLGPLDYGILAVLTSIIYIFSVPTLSIQTIVSKHATRLAANKEFGKINGFFFYMIKKIFIIASIIFIIFLALTPMLSKILNISIMLLIVTGIFIFGAFIYPVAAGILQGMKKFSAWGWNNILNSVIKLIAAMLLILLGLRVYGAILGFIIGIFLSFLFAIPYVKKAFKTETIEEKMNIFSKGVLSTFFAMFIIVTMYSIDVIFARMFFSAEIVGKYAVISMIGKIILFGAMGIGNAMFPITSEKFVDGTGARRVLKKAFFAAILWCFGLVIVFWLFPQFTVKILFGDQYTSLKNILIYVGIAFSFISFLNLFVLYKISTDKIRIKHIFILAVFLILQIFLLWFFRGNIENFAISFMFSTIITFIGSLILIKR